MGGEVREPAAQDEPGRPGPARGERLGSQPELLGEMKALRRQTRAARHAYWLPLVLFGLLTCASVPFYIQPVFPTGTGSFEVGRAGLALPFFGGYAGFLTQSAAYYWMAALLGGLLLTQLWYWWHARRVGLATSARACIIGTAVLTVLAIVIPPLSQVRSPAGLRWLHHLAVLWPGDLVVRGTFPFLIIAVGLLVLAWAERSVALTVIAVVYAGAALLSVLYDVGTILYWFGWNTPPGDQSLPNVLLPALVLLVAGTAAFAAQRQHRVVA
jgi:hypothetical protein